MRALLVQIVNINDTSNNNTQTHIIYIYIHIHAHMTFDPSCGSYRQTRCRELWPSPLGRTSARWRGVRSSIQWKLITFASMKPGGRNSWSVWRWNLEGFGVTRLLHICLFTYGVQWHSRTPPRCDTLVCFISWNKQRSSSKQLFSGL